MIRFNTENSKKNTAFNFRGTCVHFHFTGYKMSINIQKNYMGVLKIIHIKKLNKQTLRMVIK
jgi:hypothetical protein